MLQKFIKSDPNLKAEFDQLRLTGQTPGLGSAEFQQLPPDQRARFESAIEGAMDTARREFARGPDAEGPVQGAAAISPELMTYLGFERAGKSAADPFVMTVFGGVPRLVTAADVVRSAQSRLGIGGAVQEALPEETPLGGRRLGEEGIVGRLGISGLAEGPRGKLMFLSSGKTIDERFAREYVRFLRERGNSVDLQIAKNIEEAFGTTPQPAEPTPAPRALPSR